jgi:hypothetical protein
MQMNLGYQQRDNEIVDYQLYELDQGLFLRGPCPPSLAVDAYFACVGAAQTFGCFCTAPYPSILQERLGLPALNLGIAGAGPSFFARNQHLIELMNRARFVVVQVMSGRSVDNSQFESGGLELLTRRADGVKLGAEPAYRDLLTNQGVTRVRQIIAETRENWVADYRQLMESIRARKLLFWFSKRGPDYTEQLADVHALFGEFPQLVNKPMVDRIKDCADDYVECVSKRGSPQPLINRFTGEPAAIVGRADLGARRQESNAYYPSPEMHLDAAGALEPACRRLATKSRSAEETNP